MGRLLSELPWLSEDSSAFNRVPTALLAGARVPAQASVQLQVSVSRYAGLSADATPPDEYTENDFMTHVLTRGVALELCEQFGQAARDVSGRSWDRWWHIMGLDRKYNLPQTFGLEPHSPGDLDLVVGPWTDHPCVNWLIGAEVKRIKFSEAAGPVLRPKDRINKAVAQAEGLLKLGFDQALIVFAVTVRPEDLDLGMEGSGERRKVHRQVLNYLGQVFDQRVPEPIGVLVVLWDAAPRTDPLLRSEVKFFKFRRPGVNQQRGYRSQDIRERLDDSLLRALEAAGPRHHAQAMRACPYCHRPVIVAGDSPVCAGCHRLWTTSIRA